MLSIRVCHLRSLHCRRFVTGAALAAYLVSACGLPMPVAGVRDNSVPFPCQNHACGCASATQCWDNCCCYTPAQRLAWADRHGVTIPAEARRALIAAAASPAAHSACCLAGGDDHVGCDASGHQCTQCAAHDESTVTWVLGIHARKCRGLSTEWVASGATMPVEIGPLWQFDWRPVGRVAIASDPLDSLSDSPGVPPPRV